MALRQTQQQANLYTCIQSHPNYREPIGAQHFSRAALADLLLFVEESLAAGFQVTITPPANAPPPPSRIPGVTQLRPELVEVIDVQIIG